MPNPFSLENYNDVADETLVELALSGDKKSLNKLIIQNQNYIFNIALKMLNVVEEAEDATQEVLIKVITKLSSYDASKAKFRTWLYRIVFNHILKIKQSAHEKNKVTFPNFFEFMESLPDLTISEQEHTIMGIPIEEARITCTAGMLMCLNREQRLTYIVGEIFKIDHNLAAEIFEITPANFRKRLSLARKDLHQWMHKKCGLVNTNNPCRCRNKTKKFIEMGIINQEEFKWQSNYKKKIFQQIEENIDEISIDTDKIYAKFYKNDPFKISLKADEVMTEILNSKLLSL